MKKRLLKKCPGPSPKVVGFIKLFARNYKELETNDGEFARLMLERE